MEQVKLIVDGNVEIFEGNNKQECMLKMYDRTIELQKEHREKEAKENYVESKANGNSGFLLYNPFDKKYFFKIYDPIDKSKFKDYTLNAEDIQVTICDEFLSLYEGETKNKLDYSSKTLGKKHA